MARSSTRSSGTEKTSTTKKRATKTNAGSSKKSTQKSTQKSTRKPDQKDAPRAESRPSPRAGQVAARAAEELLELTGKGAEGVTGLERTEDGWVVQVEVVEVRRIPDTTDVLALYEVETDRHGSLQGYRRLRRYARGVPGED